MASKADRKALLDKVRKRLKEQRGGFQKDPHEWRPPKVGEDATWRAKCFILPPVQKGDAVASGKATLSMDELLPFIPVGDHWFNKKKYPCPRVYDNDNCPMCDFGFSLFSDAADKKMRKQISEKYLPRTYQAVNLYFPPVKSNPEELQGVVMYASLSKTIADKLDECLNRDSDGGDPDEPLPFGIFWDENEAYPLMIKIKHKGGYNDYSETKLLPKPQPIADDEDKIEEILAMRHDVAAKFGKRDTANLKTLQKLVDDILSGVGDDRDGDDDDGDSGFDTDENDSDSKAEETESEPEPEKKPKAKAKAKKKSTRTKKSEPDPEPEAEEVTVPDDDGDDLQDLLSKIESGEIE
jgi:hypothetical protein